MAHDPTSFHFDQAPPYRRLHVALDRTPGSVSREIIFILRKRGEFDALAGELYKRLDDRLGPEGYTKLLEIPLLRVVGVQVHEAHHVATLIRRMLEEGLVAGAEQNRPLRLTRAAAAVGPVVDDPLYPEQWSLEKIAAEAAWERTAGAGALTVAIVDTGISTMHPNLLPHLWTDGAGHHGFNVLDDSFDVADLDGHGTLLAGTVRAVSNNAIGSAAAAAPIRMMAVKFHDERRPPDTLTGLLGIVVAAWKRARVVVLAWDLPTKSVALESAMALLNSPPFEMLFVAGAGNDGLDNDDPSVLPTYPASYPLDNVVSVMASDSQDDRARFSNYGLTTVHLAAPGVRILSTHPSFASAAWREYGGTSAACAHVAGAAALLRALNFAWKPKQVREHLVASVDRNWWLRCEARGRLNLGRAVCGPLTVTSPSAVTVWPKNATVTVKWTRAYQTPRCTSVRVLLSENGGTTYSVLSSGHANTGSCAVKTPSHVIANARLKLQSEQGPGLYDESEVFRVQ